MGTGLNCEEGYDKEIAEIISQETGNSCLPSLPFLALVPAPSSSSTLLISPYH